jgi:hypothetical protein
VEPPPSEYERIQVAHRSYDESLLVDPSWAAIHVRTHHHTNTDDESEPMARSPQPHCSIAKKKTITIPTDSPPANLLWGKPLRDYSSSNKDNSSRPSVHPSFPYTKFSKKGHYTKQVALESPFGDPRKGYAPEGIR